MELNLGLVFVVVWLVVGFVAVRAVAARYLEHTRQANLVAAAVVLAFLAGWLAPGPRHAAAPAGPQAAGQPGGAAPPAAVRGPRPDLGGTHVASASCKAGQRPQRNDADGNVDVVLGAAEQVPEGGSVSAADPLDVQGWVTSKGAGDLADGLCFVVDGVVEPRVKVYYGVRRPDVAATYHNDKLLGSGYDARVAPGTLAPGRHRLQIAARSRDGALVTVPAARTIDFQ